MSEPKYRYFLVPPASISLTVRDLVPALPAGMWSGTERDKQRSVSLPAGEVFETNAPRIRLSRLRDLLPGCLREIPDAPDAIALPVVPLALAYQPTTRREEIPQEIPEPEAPPAAEPATEAKEAEPRTVTGKEKDAEAGPKDSPPSPAVTPSAPSDPAPSPEAAPATLPEESTPAPKPIPAWKRLLKPKLAPPPAEAAAAMEASVQNAPAAPPEPPPLPLADRRIPAEDEAKLRGLFMIEDDLTVGTLVDLSAKLPGVTGCELLTDTGVAHSTTMPTAFKPSEWIVPAREALARMTGIPTAMPVITLHPPSAAISMWLPAKFTLLVAHDERGFRPGVREKIDAAASAMQRVIS